MATTDFKDYYAILGVSKTATADEIKKVFRRLARKYHPDMNPGNKDAEASFKQVNEAYEVLSDPEKRQKYDQFGQYWNQAGPAGQGWPTGGVGVDVGNFDFSQYDSFDDFINGLLGRFGGPGGASTGSSGGQRTTYTYRTSTGSPTGFSDFSSGFDQPTVGTAADREATITLSLGDAFHGGKQHLGTGEVTIPAGVKTGSRIRIRGQGNIDPYTKQRGDLYLKVEIQPHSFFQLEGDHLICEVPITPDEAVLGAKIDVPTPDGPVNMNVPAGIRSGQSLRLRGKGWPNPKGSRGDQLVKISIAAPKDISTAEREYYEKIRDLRAFNPRSNLQQIKL